MFVFSFSFDVSAVLNVSPLSLSLSSSISPDHAEKMHELPDEYLADALPIAKKIAIAQGAENYNILQVRVTLFCEPRSPSPPPPPPPSAAAADLLCRYLDCLLTQSVCLR
jgi:hypothetical protein